MRQTIELQQQLVPELLDVMRRRFLILRQVMLSVVIGRRALATSLGMTERMLRAETDFLKSQGLIHVQPEGMRISEAGNKLLEDLEPFSSTFLGLSDLEERLKKHFGLRQVVVVAGDADTSMQTKRELGRAGCQVLQKHLRPADVVAVTGGSTIAQLSEQLTSASQLKSNWFVPARGGLGESLEYQANTIASTMARRTGAQYRLLHVPDHLGEEAYASIMLEPNIKEIVGVIREARIVVHGIGDAVIMARRRRLAPELIEEMVKDGALAEAFGYYFDRNGCVVHQMHTVGLRLDDIIRTEVVIGVAGGKSKAVAINAIMRFGHNDVLVTDEAAAYELIAMLENEQAMSLPH